MSCSLGCPIVCLFLYLSVFPSNKIQLLLINGVLSYSFVGFVCTLSRFFLKLLESAVFPELLIPVCCMAVSLSHIRSAHTKFFFFYLVGLSTLEKCQRHFPTEPKHFLPLRRLMVWMCASLACMSRNMVLSAHSPTLGRNI